MNNSKPGLTLIFDIGKTNKKALLFNDKLDNVYQGEQKFDEILDEDGFPCDDIDVIIAWIKSTIARFASSDKYSISKINFTTYGATLVYLDKDGKRITPIFNYLKPLESKVDVELYEKYGGKSEFLRKTASPALGMLNAGIQILKLKESKPAIYNKVHHVLHFPQYLSYILTNKITAEATSVGCHTALWDFDENKYHSWLGNEHIELPELTDITVTKKTEIAGANFDVGIGIHDSSASLVPYLKGSDKNFVLVSTGTWCINMNPFNNNSLTKYELENDCLSFMTYDQKPVKSSRVFLGHIHDENVRLLENHFNVSPGYYKCVMPDTNRMAKLYSKGEAVFFNAGVTPDYIDVSVDYSNYIDFEHAYHQFVIDITRLVADSVNLIISGKDQIENLYITGGFARNRLFRTMLATIFADKSVFVSEIDNATSLGAALVINNETSDSINLGLKLIKPI